jgi:hypothetical protein
LGALVGSASSKVGWPEPLMVGLLLWAEDLHEDEPGTLQSMTSGDERGCMLEECNTEKH